MSASLIVACVWTGNKYSREYVEKLYSMVDRWMPDGVDYQKVCLTDRPKELPADIWPVDITPFSLPGWWGKMALFERAEWRNNNILYFDLDTVIAGELEPLVVIAQRYEFAICQSFVIRAGHKNWPCAYGSAVMTIGTDCPDIFPRFMSNKQGIMKECVRGDQEAIERLIPDAPYLQDLTPAGYFMDRRELVKNPDRKPPQTTVICFAGPLRPHTCNIEWIKEAWK